MADRKGSLAGVALLSIILGAGIGFGLTWLVQPSGGVLQTRFLSVSSTAAKNDFSLTTTPVDDTQLNITTKGFSYITVAFAGSLGYHIDHDFMGGMTFNITLVVDGVGVSVFKASWYRNETVAYFEEGSLGVAMSWVSGTLAAGLHTVGLTWVSLYDPTGTNQIYFATSPNRVTTRTITVQEIRSSFF